jgi:DNA-binding MarR family transcriptional regulator
MPAAPQSDEELVILLFRSAKALVDRLRMGQPETGLTVVHGLAARYLVDHHDVTTVELARHLGITKQSASEVVTALEEATIVQRVPHPSDGRARVILLTKQGKARLAERRRRWNEIEDEWVELAGRNKVDAMRDALSAYLDAAGKAHV